MRPYGDIYCRGFVHALGQFLHQTDVTAVDVHFLLRFLALFLTDVFRESQFILTGKVGDAADVIQSGGVEFLLPDIVTGADILIDPIPPFHKNRGLGLAH